MNFKRILAWIGIILLAGLYIATLIFSLLNSPFAFDMFKVCILLTIAVPIILYAMILVYNYLSKK